jgi:hypothetical protein
VPAGCAYTSICALRVFDLPVCILIVSDEKGRIGRAPRDRRSFDDIPKDTLESANRRGTLVWSRSAGSDCYQAES